MNHNRYGQRKRGEPRFSDEREKKARKERKERGLLQETQLERRQVNEEFHVSKAEVSECTKSKKGNS